MKKERFLNFPEAKLRSSFKQLLPKYMNLQALTEYEILNRLSEEIIEQAENLYPQAA